ncbi:MAG: molybdopterin-guanine dinucleotide biosynthesis protein B [Desulfobacterales bacterium]|jgi:molybdopterin-guanine dinucleotide biosynthesis protein B
MDDPAQRDRRALQFSSPPSAPPAMLAVVGYSGSGKTTLLVRLIEEFCRRGLQVGTLKHDVHSFEMDRPGKDTWRHKQAGAAVTIISSPRQIGMVRDVDYDHQPQELLPLLNGMDLVLVEGFKGGSQPKIEIFRSAAHKPPACQGDPHLLAVVSDIPQEWGVPRFELEDITALADFISAHFRLSSRS